MQLGVRSLFTIFKDRFARAHNAPTVDTAACKYIGHPCNVIHWLYEIQVVIKKQNRIPRFRSSAKLYHLKICMYMVCHAIFSTLCIYDITYTYVELAITTC